MLNRQFSHLFIVTIDEDDMQKNCNSATSYGNRIGYTISVSVCLYNIHLSPSAGVGCVRVWAVSWLYIRCSMLDVRRECCGRCPDLNATTLFPPVKPHSLYNLNPDKRYVCIYMYKGDTDADRPG